MNIQLRQTRVKNLTLETLQEIDESLPVGECDLTLKFSGGFPLDPSEAPKMFCITFDLSLKTQDGLKISMNYFSEFEVDEPITDEFKSGPFPKVNAPAIAFPFLRSCINSIVVNAGYPPLILPSINFHKLYLENLKSES